VNPEVQPHLFFYPEDSGPSVSEARQAARWLHEVPNDQLTPMARIGHQDYYIHEPAMLRDGQVCIPVRWFMCQDLLYAKCWRISTIKSDLGSSWCVIIDDDFEVSQNEFLKTFPELEKDVPLYYSDIPVPSKISCKLLHIHLTYNDAYNTFFPDIFNPITNTREPWTFTDPNIGNCWHALAQGSRVATFPIWLYCDDTSGNLSKKWNKHNSFIFTAAGLPRAEAQKKFNVHFLSTSNLAPPLEMLDGVVDQLEYVMLSLFQSNLMNSY